MIAVEYVLSWPYAFQSNVIGVSKVVCHPNCFSKDVPFQRVHPIFQQYFALGGHKWQDDTLWPKILFVPVKLRSKEGIKSIASYF